MAPSSVFDFSFSNSVCTSSNRARNARNRSLSCSWTSLAVRFCTVDLTVELKTTANLCTPGTNVEMEGEVVTRHCSNSKSPTLHGDQWVTAEVEVLGNDRVVHYVNGEEVMRYQRPQLDPGDPDAKAIMQRRNGELMLSRGWISLQGESHPVEFKSVETILKFSHQSSDKKKSALSLAKSNWVSITSCQYDISAHI